jgi:formylglycine-generating enzyme required for sulfatase activity/CheY-like chemotaxis protein
MPKTVLLVQPNPDLFQTLSDILKQIPGDIQVVAASTGADAQMAYSTVESVDLLITEVYLEGADGLGLLYNFRQRFPQCPVLITTSFDLKDYQPYIEGLPQFVPPFQVETLTGMIVDSLGVVEGQVWQPYKVGKHVGRDRWGDCYEAFDQGVKRKVYLSVLNAGASPEQIDTFQKWAAAMASSVHPNVTAVFAAGENQGRYFFAREFWLARSLQDMIQAAESLEPRLAARIIHTVTTVLLFWESNKYAYRELTATDVTVTPNGIVKLVNAIEPTATLGQNAVPSLHCLATALEALLPKTDLPPRLVALLNLMKTPEVTLTVVSREAQTLDTELAPKREVVVTKEHKIAEAAIAAERKRQKIVTYLSVAGFVLLILGFIAFMMYQSGTFSDPVFKDFKKMIRIPAGEFTYQNGETQTTGEFYIDEYEVTIGQYKEFLEAVAAKGSSADYDHPLQEKKGKDHTPVDWETIIESIRQDALYRGQKLTLNSPVFNVDWFDAQAYAKWAGKRLPTEVEWEKASRGLKGNKYPWGNEFDPKLVSAAFIQEKKQVDGFVGVAPVDAMQGDVSPFGVKDMAGNVSEWTDTILKKALYEIEDAAAIRGGNFMSKTPEDCATTRRIKSQMPVNRLLWVGFRCVSDTPPKEKEDDKKK